MSNTIIFTGPRDMNVGQADIAYAIEQSGFGRPTWVIVGSMKGLDYCAERFAYTNLIDSHLEPAEWKKYGKIAGPLRNMYMASHFNAKGTIAFARAGEPVTSGTASMVAESVRVGIPVYICEV